MKMLKFCFLSLIFFSMSAPTEYFFTGLRALLDANIPEQTKSQLLTVALPAAEQFVASGQEGWLQALNLTPAEISQELSKIVAPADAAKCSSIRAQLEKLKAQFDIVALQSNTHDPDWFRDNYNGCPILHNLSKVITDLMAYTNKAGCDTSGFVFTPYRKSCQQAPFRCSDKANPPLPKANVNLLFMGNSLSYANSGIENIVKGLLESGYLRGYAVTAQKVGDGGEPIYSYMKRLKSNPALLDDKSWLILHDQSQVPSLYLFQEGMQCNPAEPKSFPCSMQGTKDIVALARSKGVNVMLESTWGYKDGDMANQDLNPNFLAMNQNLSDAYCMLANNNMNIPVAPVGLAFQKVYMDSYKHGVEPLSPGALFGRLYTDDVHPAPIGSYLFGLVVYASLTGQSPEGIAWMPSDTVGKLKPGEQAYLQCVAASAVLGQRDCAFAN